MAHAPHSSIYWRQKPIESLETEELRLALGEAVASLLGNTGRQDPNSFMLGLVAGTAFGAVISLAALLLLALF